MARKRAWTPTLIARRAIQFGMVALVSYFGIRHQIVGGRGGAAPIDSYCPFGAIESLPSLFSGAGFVAKVGMSNLVLLAALGVVTLGVSGAFCGWLCPFGALQDWLASAGRAIFGRQYRVPEPVHRYLKYLRWVVLAVIVYMSWTTLGLWFAEYDPYRAFVHFKFESWVAYALVAGTLALGLAVERAWCLYLCPLGPIVGTFGKLGLVKVRRVEAECNDCGVCGARCPMAIPVQSREVVRDEHCTMCTECVESCPGGGGLVLSTGARGESLRPMLVGVAATALFFAIIGTAWSLGFWQTGGGGGCQDCANDPQAVEAVAVVPPGSSPPAPLE